MEIRKKSLWDIPILRNLIEETCRYVPGYINKHSRNYAQAKCTLNHLRADSIARVMHFAVSALVPSPRVVKPWDSEANSLSMHACGARVCAWLCICLWLDVCARVCMRVFGCMRRWDRFGVACFECIGDVTSGAITAHTRVREGDNAWGIPWRGMFWGEGMTWRQEGSADKNGSTEPTVVQLFTFTYQHRQFAWNNKNDVSKKKIGKMRKHRSGSFPAGHKSVAAVTCLANATASPPKANSSIWHEGWKHTAAARGEGGGRTTECLSCVLTSIISHFTPTCMGAKIKPKTKNASFPCQFLPPLTKSLPNAELAVLRNTHAP